MSIGLMSKVLFMKLGVNVRKLVPELGIKFAAQFITIIWDIH
jgi:hypothetical protein